MTAYTIQGYWTVSGISRLYNMLKIYQSSPDSLMYPYATHNEKWIKRVLQAGQKASSHQLL